MAKETLAHLRGRTENPDFDCLQTAFLPDPEGKGILSTAKNLLARLTLRRQDESKREQAKCYSKRKEEVAFEAIDTNDFFFDEGRWQSNPSGNSEKKISKRQARRNRRNRNGL